MSSMSGDPQGPSNANPSFTSQSLYPKVDKTSGALVQSYQITVPKGRNGLQPNISLTYDSQNLEDGVFGYGWSINIPYIERINRRGTDNLYTDKYFNSSLSGELSSTTIFNEYKPKFEEPNSLRYTFSTTTGSGGTWIAYDKNGTKYSFGTSTNARQEDGSNSSKVYKWMLQEVRDSNNNYIRFEYYKDEGQIYPYKIYYTGNASTDGIFQIEFNRETRTDVISSYKTAFLVKTNYRINQIQTKINGTWVRKYDLTYKNGSNSYRSLIGTILESAQDESGTGSISLPSVFLDYTKDAPLFNYENNFNLSNITGSFWVTADTNGDGLLDQNVSFINNITGLTNNTININKGDKTAYTYNRPNGGNNSPYYDERWATQNNSSAGFSPREEGTRFFDINGDLLPDVVRAQSVYQSADVKKIYLNDGTYATTSDLSWTQSTNGTTTMPSFSSTNISGNPSTNGLLGNLNGDSLVDFSAAITGYTDAYLGNGISFYASSTIFTPVTYIPSYGNVDVKASQLVDINGDGLDDWVYTNSTTTQFCLNTGLAFGTCENGFKLSTTTVDQYGNDKGVRFIDINGDGLLDFVRSYNMPQYTMVAGGSIQPPEVGVSNMVMYNTGSGWVSSTTTLPFTIISYVVNGSIYNSSIPPYISEMWDWSGDGIADGSPYKNLSRKQDVLNKVTYSTGGFTSVNYEPSTQKRVNNLPKHVNLPLIVYLVSDITNNDAHGNSEVISYTYENGDMYFNGGYDRKFAGFENIIETKDDSIIKTYFHQGNSASTTAGELIDSVSLIGKSYREDILSTTGSILKKTFYKWGSTSKSNNRFFVSLSKVMEQSFDGDSSHKDKAVSYLYNTDTSSLIQQINHGEVTGNTDGTFTDVGSDLASTTISYVASTTANMSLPSQEVTQNQSLSKVKETKYYYDNLSFGSVGKGNQTKQELWKTGSLYASTSKTYNSYGLVTQDKDARGNATNYTHDTYNLYVATSTNPLSQTTAYTHDYSSGKIKQTVDPNSRVFQSIYDGLDRLKEIKQPDIYTPSSLVTKTLFTYTDNTVPSKVQETNYLNSATSTDKYTYFDGLGRKIQERYEAEGNNTFVVRDYVYNNTGKILKDSLPYFASSTSISSSTSNNLLYNNYTYDGLGRILTVNNAIGTTTNIYDDWHVTIVDPRGKPKDYYRDAHDNLINVVEHNAGIHATTTYAYDLNKNLTSVTDALGNVRNFTYDGLSRRLTAQDLHASADATFGTYTYVYDDTNNITQKVDPKSQTVNYTYDVLNRPLTEDFTGAAGTEVTYTYDVGVDGKGRLTKASSTDAKITNSYNAIGWIRFSTTTIAGVGYANEYDYDRLGNYTFVAYPDGSRVKYWYNSAGQLENITQSENGGSYSSIINNFDYNPLGKVRIKDFGNGVQTIYSFDQNALYRLTNILTIRGGVGGSLEDMLLESSSTTEEILFEVSNLIPTTTEETLIEDIVDIPVKSVLEISTTTISEVENLAIDNLFLEELATTSEIVIEEKEAIATTTNIVFEAQIEEIQEIRNERVLPLEIITQNRLRDSGVTKSIISKYEPKVVLEKWDGEVRLGVGYDGVLPTTKGKEVKSKTKHIEWKDIDEKLEAISLEPVEGMEDGGVKINIVLNSKPTKNTFNFQLNGWENLDFFYQDALWKEEGLKEPVPGCSDTDCVKSNGKHYYRPENIVGSYAVYYKDKRDYLEGGVNYGTGKAFHIYRPLILDSNGKQVWGDMKYDSGVISITVPQDFLDNAEYPITVDPTFGYTSVGASTNDFGGNVLYAKANNTPSSNGTLTSMSIYGKINTSTPNFNPALYSNVSNAPGTRLANIDNGGTNYGSSSSWVTTNINYNGITSGTQYWLGFKSENVGPLVNYDTGGAGTLHYGAGASWNTTADDVGNENGIYSIYATYTASSISNNPTILQNISYLYDANGNITQINDTSDTGVAKTVVYTYDDLNRLTVASTTSATSTPYRHQWTYDALGNITAQNNGIGTTTYKYEGNIGSTYSNPHTPTSLIKLTSGAGGISTSTPVFVQSKKDTINSAVTLNSSVTNGNLIVVGLTSYNESLVPNAISDNKGNTYTRIMEVVNYNTDDHGAIYYAKNVNGGSSFTVSSSVGGTLAVHEYSGISPYSPLDKYSSSTGSSAVPSSSSVTTDIANELYFGLAWNQSDGSAWNSGYGYSLRENETNNATLERIATQDGVITSATTTQSFFTTGNSPWLAAIATFLPATTTGGNSTTTLVYDNNGNLISDGTSTYTWDWRNRLTQSVTNSATSSYAYDHTVNRVKLTQGSTTTIYPNKFYTKGTSTTTKSIFANDVLLSNIYTTGGSTSTTTNYTIFGDSTNWSDWSWGSTRDFNETTVVYSGTKSLEVAYTTAWGGLHLRSATGVNTATSTHLQFAVRSSTANPTIEIDAYGSSDTFLGYAMLSNYLPGGTMSADTWYLVSIPLADLSAANTTYTGFVAMRSTTGTLFFDDIKLISVSGGGGTTTTTSFVHEDHLNSTNVVSDSVGTVTQVLDYYPYGAGRINSSSSGVDEKQKFAGMERDNISGLDYAQNRYYSNTRGQFISQDPVFWEIGQSIEGKGVLNDPQLQNSYSWAKNNPILYKDPNGRFIPAIAGQLVILAIRSYLINLALSETALVTTNVYGNVKQDVQNNNFSASSFIPTVTGEQYLDTAGGAVVPSLLGPAGAVGAKFAGVSKLVGSSVGVGAGEAYNAYNSKNGDASLGQVGFSFFSNFAGNYAGGKIIGNTVGRDVKSIFSPNFYTGAHTRNDFKSGAISQGVVSVSSATYSGLASSLSQLVSSLQSLVSSLQSSSNNKK